MEAQKRSQVPRHLFYESPVQDLDFALAQSLRDIPPATGKRGSDLSHAALPMLRWPK